jgi:hypothetical protein
MTEISLLIRKCATMFYTILHTSDYKILFNYSPIN